MLPLHAAVPICPPLLAGEEQEIDFGAPLRPGLRHGTILRAVDGSPSATPLALRELLGAADISFSTRTRRCARLFVALRRSQAQAPDVRRDARLGSRRTCAYEHVSVVYSS